VPIRLEYAQTRLAHGDERKWIKRRFTGACAEMGTHVTEEEGTLIIDWEK
jgi:hypothetical protein